MVTLQGGPLLSILQVGGWGLKSCRLAQGQELERVLEVGLDPEPVLALKHTTYDCFCISPSPRNDSPFYPLIPVASEKFPRASLSDEQGVQIRGVGGGEVSKVQMIEGDQRRGELRCRWAVRRE